MNGPLRVGGRLVGCVVDAGAADSLWRICAAELRRRETQKLAVAPHLRDAVDGLRQTVLEHSQPEFVSATGPVSRTRTDTPPRWSTNDLAERLRCDPRTVRRWAKAAGLVPLARGVWPAQAADVIEESRRTA